MHVLFDLLEYVLTVARHVDLPKQVFVFHNDSSYTWMLS